MESRTVLVTLVAICCGILSATPVEAADPCELSGGVLKGDLCFLPCDNPGEVRVKQPNGQLTCVPSDQPAAAAPPAKPDQPAEAAPPAKPDQPAEASPPATPDQPAADAKPAAPVQPDQPVAPAKQAADACVAKGGVRLGSACFLPCPNPGETRVQFANGTLKCVVIAQSPEAADTKAKLKKAPAPAVKKKR